MIRQGERFEVGCGVTGQGKNTTGDVPVRLRLRLPCCKREHRPAYDQVLLSLKAFGNYPVRCNGCKWWWKIVAVADERSKVTATITA